MILAVCVDDKGGMLFNRRRQSQDRLLRQNLLEEAAGRAVWMNAYSYKQFVPAPENVRCAEDFFTQAGEGEFCFFERLRNPQVAGLPMREESPFTLLFSIQAEKIRHDGRLEPWTWTVSVDAGKYRSRT